MKRKRWLKTRQNINTGKTMHVHLKILLILQLINHTLVGQLPFNLSDIDSTCIVIYEGMKLYPIPIPPIDRNDTLEVSEIILEHEREMEALVGIIDTATQMQPKLTHLIIDEKDKYNPIIIWSSLTCLDKDASQKLLPHITCDQVIPDSLVTINTPQDCYYPRHGIIFYDKNKKVIGTLAICFQCKNTIVNYKLDYYDCVNYHSLREVFENLNIPVFKDQEAFYEYQRVNFKLGN